MPVPMTCNPHCRSHEVAAIQARGLEAQVWMECTIWETAWYLRRMDLLMLDMAADDEKA